MAELFLIRRQVESLMGPYTLKELKAAYARMEFGLSDEVSGHLRPWVFLENKEELARYYPKLMAVFYPDSVPAPKPKGLTQQFDQSLLDQVKPRKKNNLTSFLVLVLLGCVGFLAYQLHLRSKVEATEILPQDVTQAYHNQGVRKAVQVIKQNYGLIRKQLAAGKSKDWLPALRLFAFQHSGALAGLSPRLLAGPIKQGMPTDCSTNAWGKRWRGVLVEGKGMTPARLRGSGNSPARLLALDPFWVSRRKDQNWLDPGNYMEGCIRMALKAYRRLVAGNGEVLADLAGLSKQIGARLVWMDSVIAGKKPTRVQMEYQGLLGGWTCMEAAQTSAALLECVDLEPEQTASDLPDTLNQRYYLNQVRLLLEKPQEFKEELGTLLEGLGSKDRHTGMDFMPEYSVLLELQKKDVERISEVLRAVENRYSNIRFIE